MVRTGQAEHTSSGIPVSIIEGISSNSSNHAPCHCSAPDRHHRRPAPALLLRAVADLMLLRVVAWLPAVAWLSAVAWLPAVAWLGVSRLPDCVALLPAVAGLPRRHLRALVYMRPALDAKVGRGKRMRDAALPAVSRRLPGLLAERGGGGGVWLPRNVKLGQQVAARRSGPAPDDGYRAQNGEGEPAAAAAARRSAAWAAPALALTLRSPFWFPGSWQAVGHGLFHFNKKKIRYTFYSTQHPGRRSGPIALCEGLGRASAGRLQVARGFRRVGRSHLHPLLPAGPQCARSCLR